MVSKKIENIPEDVPLNQLISQSNGNRKAFSREENVVTNLLERAGRTRKSEDVVPTKTGKKRNATQEGKTRFADPRAEDSRETTFDTESGKTKKNKRMKKESKQKTDEESFLSLETKANGNDCVSEEVSRPSAIFDKLKKEEFIIERAQQNNDSAKGTKRAEKGSPKEVGTSEDEREAEEEEEEEEEEDYRWWGRDNQEDEDDTIKWTTLSHSGVLFPPEYVPHNKPILYRGKEIYLSPKAEEVATFFAQKLATEYVKKPQFRKNFWEDFQQHLSNDEKKKLKSLDEINFTPIYEHLEAQKNAKKALTSAEKKAIREEEQEKVKKYTVAIVDGKEEKVGNFRVEPPGLFLGRGEHPLMGKVKKRIMPEDITINIGEDAPVPECPIAGHRWGQIIHNNKVTWLAGWKDSITGGYKYVWLSAGSRFKGQSDQQKYEKARKLKNYIDEIRKDYTKGLQSDSLEERQRSTALYFIDRLALRVGNEKDEDEADTVGCCSLRVEHITLHDPNAVEFDFLGKDSIRYINTVTVDGPVFYNLKEFVRGKKPEDEIFDKLTVQGLNDHLKTLMPGLSAKVFRTYNASITLARLLSERKFESEDLNNKLTFYNQANKEVAILCNHQRTLPVSHEQQMNRLQSKLDEALEWLHELEQALKKAKRDKKDSVEVVQYVRPKPNFRNDMTQIEREAERKRVAELPQKAEQRVEKIRLDMSMKEELKNVALGTSKINYLDPRITVAWCKKNQVPIEKIFSKTLLTKFLWSMESSEDFCF
ncbi:DNA topoisomerase 1 [Galdieria sulphuraria]|nr:DNA topoisomerase 1 [Galdieria sulphuraria]